MKFVKFTTATAVAVLMTALGTTAKAQESVEVLHWWTSGGEAAALNVLKQNLEKDGVMWQDMPVAGGGGNDAMTVLRARVTAGNPPTAVQLLGYDILDWAQEGALGNLDSVADSEGWDKVIPSALQKFAKYDGHWIAAPVNVHSTNWLWISKAALDNAGGKAPETWDELVAVLDKMKANGITPIVGGGNAWNVSTMFESVVLSEGADFYKKAFVDFDPAALGSDTMVDAFKRLAKLRSYVDSNFSGREWNLDTAMVINGEAGMQVMGDWAKGEILKAGKVPGKDIVCIRFPGTQGSVLFNSDMFGMFNVGKDQLDAQYKMASAILDPVFQSSFNVVKGSVPARTDVPDTAFDACGKKGIKDLAEANTNGTLLGSMTNGYTSRAAVKNAEYDVVNRAYNGDLSPDEAAKELVSAIAAAM